MDVDLVPVENDGSPVAVMVQLSDLTEKKRLEEQLIRSERLASLSQFASMFAHDIRNPLVGIKKTLELLAQDEGLQPAAQRQWWDDMRFTIDLLLGMINDMLDVYQESYSGLPLLTSMVSVNSLVADVVQLFRTEATAKRIAFHLEMPEDEVAMTADRRRLLRVLINLVHNALKFSPQGGTITVTVCAETRGCTGRESRGTSSSRRPPFRLRTKDPASLLRIFRICSRCFAGGKIPEIFELDEGWGCIFAAWWWRPIGGIFGQRIVRLAVRSFSLNCR